MASFGHFLGHRVTVQYRVGDVLLPASGLFAADSGRSIFLEQHVEQKGKRSYFRWEIPYQFIYKIEAMPEAVEQPAPELPAETQIGAAQENPQAAAASAGSGMAPSGNAALVSLPHRPKMA